MPVSASPSHSSFSRMRFYPHSTQHATIKAHSDIFGRITNNMKIWKYFRKAINKSPIFRFILFSSSKYDYIVELPSDDGKDEGYC